MTSYSIGAYSEQLRHQISKTYLQATNTNPLCSNQSFMQAIRCLNSDFSSWFKYNVSNIDKELSEADFKALGGVCSQASEWYVKSADKLGFYGITVKLFSNSPVGHEIAILYDENISSYCVIDQELIVGCQKLQSEKSRKAYEFYLNNSNNSNFYNWTENITMNITTIN